MRYRIPHSNLFVVDEISDKSSRIPLECQQAVLYSSLVTFILATVFYGILFVIYKSCHADNLNESFPNAPLILDLETDDEDEDSTLLNDQTDQSKSKRQQNYAALVERNEPLRLPSRQKSRLAS